jgi:sulfotransferase
MSLYFLSGLPRSGSTLLSNILLQNPEIYVTATSGLIEVVRSVRDICDRSPQFRAMPVHEKESVKVEMIRGLMAGRFREHQTKTCFDKSRGWPSMLEFLKTILGSRDRIKVLVCVRDLRDILASFEKLYRKTSETSTTPQERHAFFLNQTALKRASFMMNEKEPVGRAVEIVNDALTRGWSNRLLFIDYDKLCKKPDKTISKIYRFLNLKSFDHDFDNIEQKTQENDEIYGFKGLHTVESKVKVQNPQWNEVFDVSVINTPFWSTITKQSRFWER